MLSALVDYDCNISTEIFIIKNEIIIKKWKIMWTVSMHQQSWDAIFVLFFVLLR